MRESPMSPGPEVITPALLRNWPLPSSTGSKYSRRQGTSAVSRHGGAEHCRRRVLSTVLCEGVGGAVVVSDGLHLACSPEPLPLLLGLLAGDLPVAEHIHVSDVEL